ncbi:MAG: double-stranded DNA-binding protein [Nitrososphaera sp.]|nr:double-stranded DNA-binding protein [Nitrososphaera sp.]
MSDDSDIEIIKARKMMELRKKAAAQEKVKTVKTPKETVLSFLYDRGDEVLKAAYAQYPTQTEAIVNKIAELVAAGEIQQKISGGELLSLFRSIGMRIRLDTSIKIEDHGKMVSFSDKLKQNE